MPRLRPRPSAASRWCAGGCRGSVALSAQYPDRSGPAAENGSRLHDLAATALKGGERVYGPEDARVVDPYVADVLREHWGRPGSTLNVEQPVRWGLNPILEGTPDAVLLDVERQHVIIWDLKTGWRPVEVEENWQLLSYATMVTPPRWQTELRIVQPLPYHPNGSVRAWMLPWHELQSRMVTLDQALKEVQMPDAALITGAHCMYCPAITACPAARQASLGAVDHANSPPHDLPDVELGRELSMLREAKKILDLRTAALEEEISTKLRSGSNIPGVYMREGKGGRINWVDEDAARATLRVLLNRDPAVPKMPTPTQLRDQGINKELLAPLTSYKPGKMVVSTDADDRAQKIFQHEPNMEHTQNDRNT